MTYIKELYRTDITRNRMSYFGNTLMVIFGSLFAGGAGLTMIASESGGFTMFLGIACCILAVVYYTSTWWLFASRIRDIGWNVTLNVIAYIVLSVASTAMTGSDLGVLVGCIAFGYGLAVLFVPGKEPALTV